MCCNEKGGNVIGWKIIHVVSNKHWQLFQIPALKFSLQVQIEKKSNKGTTYIF